MTQRAPTPNPDHLDTPTEETKIWEVQTQSESSTLRWAYAVAVLFHVVLFALQVPISPPVEAADKVRTPIYVIQQTPIQPQELPPQEAPKPKAVKKFIPDPTPDDPEPLPRDLELEPDLELASDDLFPSFEIPSAPPPIPQTGPIFVSGDVQAPVALSKILPEYTESARRLRLEGLVIVQAEIDVQGKVRDVKVLKSLGFGLDESAIKAVEQWRFTPATLRGKPVAVYFSLSVQFQLQ